ncbi:Retrotransposon-derived protein PEG10 [Smittium culicis]|uniref:Retrotransposon-derived protein PEG10 n=1 Tax=Smittium culicis TaxID=133412 RepID=A0A1R1Y9T1_9FUNG|nr:Retrotransposon-derived protein PEG10 [Smittium culicis]
MTSEEIQQLTAELQRLTAENAGLLALQTNPVPSHAPAPRLALPERYDGDRSQFRGFVNQCRLLFFTHPDLYATTSSKVGLIMSLLTGNALRWASPYIEKGSLVLQDYEVFLKEFSKVFDDPQRTQTANDAIRALHQGTTPVSMYASEFRRLLMDLDWNESALVSQFAEGLSDKVLDTLALFETPTDLEGYINAAITVDARLTRRREDKTRRRVVTTLPQPQPARTSHKLMQVDAVQRTVSQPERDRRMKLGLCFYCGGEKHQATNCSGTERKPSLNPPPASTIHRPPDSKTRRTFRISTLNYTPHPHRFLVHVSIHLPSIPRFSVTAMIDSGASGIFINMDIVDQFSIPVSLKKTPVQVEFIDGSSMNEGPITQHTKPLLIQIQRNHWEKISFDLIKCNHADVILSLPWLELHEPSLNWKKRTISFQSTHCRKNCIKKTTPSTRTTIKTKSNTTYVDPGPMPAPSIQAVKHATDNHSHATDNHIHATENHSHATDNHSHATDNLDHIIVNHDHSSNNAQISTDIHSLSSPAFSFDYYSLEEHLDSTTSDENSDAESEPESESDYNSDHDPNHDPTSDSVINMEPDYASESDSSMDPKSNIEESTPSDPIPVAIPTVTMEIIDEQPIKPMTPPLQDPVEPNRKRIQNPVFQYPLYIKKRMSDASHMIGLIAQARPKPQQPEVIITIPSKYSDLRQAFDKQITEPRPIWQPKILVGALDTSNVSDLLSMIKSVSKTDAESQTLISKAKTPRSLYPTTSSAITT